ncbi:hypothetical protein FB567DRAFT_352720 [Paraphoma chrysanthemicola]|uniref:Uncharacterized protein n=1 Tax=Paraphoma chrysanthemicola TaxID=798071 RepID=A0A8K0VZQ0_9PLEO|nr:hypothetical protein FB567DRAFT_352720 [Paraphoma chrysanthemicola]
MHQVQRMSFFLWRQMHSQLGAAESLTIGGAGKAQSSFSAAKPRVTLSIMFHLASVVHGALSRSTCRWYSSTRTPPGASGDLGRIPHRSVTVCNCNHNSHQQYRRYQRLCS